MPGPSFLSTRPGQVLLILGVGAVATMLYRAHVQRQQGHPSPLKNRRRKKKKKKKGKDTAPTQQAAQPPATPAPPKAASVQLLDQYPDLQLSLRELVERHLVVVTTGLPGVGKSMVTNMLVHLAVSMGKNVTMIQHDVGGMVFKHTAFASPDFDEDSEQDQLLVRHATGLWARAELAKFAEAHRSSSSQQDDLMVVEAPLVGGRFVDLVRKHDDDAESFLRTRSGRCVFAAIVPSKEVRAFIVDQRKQRMENPLHEQEKEDCPVDLLHQFWLEAYKGAQRNLPRLNLADTDNPPFDPTVYAALYSFVCQHRKFQTLSVTKTLDTSKFTVYDFDSVQSAVSTLKPSKEDVQRFLQRARESAQSSNALRPWTYV